MQVAKWGNSLAVRLPAELVRKLGLKEGDDIDIQAAEARLIVARHQRADEILAGLRQFRGRLPKEDRLSRDEAHAR
ncbi:MAG: AbrB/MazE/SpoVT family DNA-binding domain-containing protein [Alteriqipengyuania sp.]|jgi:antitoxin MazE